MSSAQEKTNIIARSPIARAVLLAALLGGVFLCTLFVRHTSHKKPLITAITPPIGSPGDVIVISGNNFGSQRDTSFVEIAGSRITASGYLSWSNTHIHIALPSNVQDGLVIVETDAGTSEPHFFANKEDIPVVVQTDVRTVRPIISSIYPSEAHIGDSITIKGSNFGNSRGASRVFFSTERSGESLFLCANDVFFDYEYWSDTEIRVRVPDGACSGPLFVETSKGKSTEQEVSLGFSCGKKTYTEQKKYSVQVSTDIQNRAVEENNFVTLYIPRPPVYAAQPAADLAEVSPEPLIKNDPRNVIQHIALEHAKDTANSSRVHVNQQFMVSVLAEQTHIEPANVKPYSQTTTPLYSMYTAADAFVPSAAAKIVTLAQDIAGGVKNPYEKALRIYNYLIDNFKTLGSVRTGSTTVLEALEQKSLDAYDITILFVALCRAQGIPALPISGVLVETNRSTQNHWWAHIYFEQYGWFPVDIALGAGLFPQLFAATPRAQDGTVQRDVARNFYFGNLDADRIAFSAGVTTIKPALTQGNTVFKTRTYALQSVWEESTGKKAQYSAFWNNPVVTTVY